MKMKQGSIAWQGKFLQSRRVMEMLAIMLAAMVVFIDWITWIELNVSIVYGLPLVLAATARNRRLLWGLALVLIVTIFAVYAVQIPMGIFAWHEMWFVNRLLSLVAVLLTAGLLHAWTLAVDELETQRLELQERNQQLMSANQELLDCRVEITRQNVELERRREAAEGASGQKTRLLATVSHDIRSPLNAIHLTAEVIQRAVGTPAFASQIPGLALRLQANAKALSDMVADLLDVASLQSGQVPLHESEFSLNDLILEERLRLLTLAQNKGLEFLSELPAEAIWLWADRMKLARILTNLVTNAIKFTQRGTVTLMADKTDNGGVLLRVLDTGIGIAPEHLEMIFDEYARVGASEAGPATGWGLGLAICKRLAESMDGDLTVESQVQCGSIFSVTFPAWRVVKKGSKPVNELGVGAAQEHPRTVSSA
jgi:signal transduction histidine kinase